MNREPHAPSLTTKAHGRIESVQCALRFCMVCMFSFASRVSPALLLASAASVGICGLYAYIVYQPYYKPVVNRLHAAFYALYCWACVCATVLEVRRMPEVRLSLLWRRIIMSVSHSPGIHPPPWHAGKRRSVFVSIGRP